MNKVFYMWLSGSILIAAIICFRHFFSHRIPKRFMVFLWIFAIARLLLPISIPVQWHVQGFWIPEVKSDSGKKDSGVSDGLLMKDTMYTDTTGCTDMVYTDPDEVHKASRTVLKENPWLMDIVFTVWLTVSILIAMKILVKHIRSRKIYNMSLPVCEEKAAEWLCTHRSFRRVTLRSSEFAVSPLTYGIFRPVILLPSKINFSEEEFLCVMEHEWVHIRWWDVLVKYILYLAVCIYWFHPMVWGMAVLMDRDMEMACDEEVVRKYSGNLRTTYALTLIRLAEGCRSPIGPVNACFASQSKIEERIQLIMKKKKYSRKAVALAIVMFCCAATTFTTAAKEPPEEADVTAESTDLNKADVAVDKADVVDSKADTAENEADVAVDKADVVDSKADTAENGVNVETEVFGNEIDTAENGVNVEANVVGNKVDTAENGINIAVDKVDAAKNEADAFGGKVTVTDKKAGNGQVAKLAANYIGNPYQYGGTDLYSGVDSLGFVKAIYSLVGVDLPGDIQKLAASGTEISVEELSAGDIIFYGKADENQAVQLSHVGIYNGDGQVIHASNMREGIKISDYNYREIGKVVRILK